MTMKMLFANSMPNDLDSQLEKLSLRLIQNSLYNNKPKSASRQYLISKNKSHSLYSVSQEELKITETSSINKKEKKMVRFADALGFELVTVRFMSNSFINEKINYQSEDEDEEFSDEFSSDSNEYNSEPVEEVKYAKFVVKNNSYNNSAVAAAAAAEDPNSFSYDNLNFTWECLFEQPGISPDFYSKVNNNKVILEAIYTNHFKLNGFVRVRNLSLSKRVFIRYTLNNWKSYNDSECCYLMNGTSDNSQTDRFKFSIVLDKTGLVNSIDETSTKSSTSPVLKFEFAVCFQANYQSDHSQSFWDNNDSKNYQYNCFFKILNPYK